MEKLKDKMDDINLSNEESELEIETEKNRFTYDLKARDQLFKEINEINDEILELEEAIAKTDEQLEEIREKRRDMISLGKEQEKEKFRIKEQELLVKAKSIAKDKVSKGEKLTFEELKLVYGNELE